MLSGVPFMLSRLIVSHLLEKKELYGKDLIIFRVIYRVDHFDLFVQTDERFSETNSPDFHLSFVNVVFGSIY